MSTTETDTAGDADADADTETQADTDTAPVRLIDRFESDRRLVAAAFALIYVVFLAFALVLGYPMSSIVSVLAQVTFLVAAYALAVLALNLHWGYTGLFNIGVAGFMAIGVYTMAILSASPAGSPPGLGLPYPVGVLGGMLVAAIVGVLAALPALRLRADYLAIVTVALAEIIRLTFNARVFAEVTVFGTRLGTGGGGGFNNLPPRPIDGLFYQVPGSASSEPTALGEVLFGLGTALGITREAVLVSLTYGLFLLLVVWVVYVVVGRAVNSPFGRLLKAIREDEDVARALGKDTRRTKIVVFALGCALMGLAGILWQGSRGSVNPTLNFLPRLTFYIFIALIIGGAGSNTGAVLGGALFAAGLFLAPQFVANIVSQAVNLGTAPNTIAAAIAQTAGGEPLAILGYAIDQISALRFVLIGGLLVYLMQRRPEGLLGHRKEPAASIDLTARSRPPRAGSGSEPTAADGGRATATTDGETTTQTDE